MFQVEILKKNVKSLKNRLEFIDFSKKKCKFRRKNNTKRNHIME